LPTSRPLPSGENPRQPPGRESTARSRRLTAGRQPIVNRAVQALRDLLEDPDRDDWDELLAANRALIKAIAKNKPMTRSNARIVAEYLREAGWRERAIGAATKSGADLESIRGYCGSKTLRMP
jgi:hypothetical protein